MVEFISLAGWSKRDGEGQKTREYIFFGVKKTREYEYTRTRNHELAPLPLASPSSWSTAASSLGAVCRVCVKHCQPTWPRLPRAVRSGNRAADVRCPMVEATQLGDFTRGGSASSCLQKHCQNMVVIMANNCSAATFRSRQSSLHKESIPIIEMLLLLQFQMLTPDRQPLANRCLSQVSNNSTSLAKEGKKMIRLSL